MSWKVIGARFQISQRVCRIPVSVKLRWIIPENIFSWKLGGWCFLILWNWWVKVLSLYHATWARWNHVLYDKIKVASQVTVWTCPYLIFFRFQFIHKHDPQIYWEKGGPGGSREQSILVINLILLHARLLPTPSKFYQKWIYSPGPKEIHLECLFQKWTVFDK